MISFLSNTRLNEHTLLSGTESGRVVLAEVVVVVAVRVEHCCCLLIVVVVVVD